MELAEKIQKIGKKVGFDLVGITKLNQSKYKKQIEKWVQDNKHGEMYWYARNLDRRINPTKNLYGQAISAITVGLYYRPMEIPVDLKADPSRGLIARYAQYNDYHDVMMAMINKFADLISIEINQTWNYHIYIDTGPILEREVAENAGMGFIGKNTTLINPALGSYFFIGEIICDLDIEQDSKQKLFKQGTCGLCTRCLQNCPTKALTKPYQLDARRCISYLTIENKKEIPVKFRPLLKNWIYGCDICQQVCPWNKRISDNKFLKLRHRRDLVAPKLLDLLDITENSFQKIFIDSPILRIKWPGLMRNILVATGNWGDKKALLVVKKYLKHNNKIIREHANWALKQINNKN